jgi:lipopolysaccharide transport protein LptA
MAPTDRKLRWPAALIACGAAAVAVAQAPPLKAPTALSGSCAQPINLDAASSEVDYKTNTVVFKDVVISQCDMRIQSDRAHATGLNFANSKWDFEGNVRIDAEQRGNLRSDSAVVEFRDNHILRATVTGKPANFEQKRNGSEQMARGHADKILYDISDGTVRLTDDAWLSDGQSEISGPVLVYNIRAQKVQADTKPDDGQRVHIIIQPRGGTGKDAGKTPDAGKPQPTPQS